MRWFFKISFAAAITVVVAVIAYAFFQAVEHVRSSELGGQLFIVGLAIVFCSVLVLIWRVGDD